VHWDLDSRSWHVPPGSDLRPFAEWLPVSPSPDDPLLAIAGLRQPCWKCGAPTVAVVACKDDDLKEWIFAGAVVLQMLASQIPAEALAAVGAGPLRPRYSYTTECSYWSNGCVKCGALLGEFPLFEEFSEYMSHQSYELPVIARARVSQDVLYGAPEEVEDEDDDD
jgi:Domain of unknown function (DUF5710)